MSAPPPSMQAFAWTCRAELARLCRQRADVLVLAALALALLGSAVLGGLRARDFRAEAGARHADAMHAQAQAQAQARARSRSADAAAAGSPQAALATYQFARACAVPAQPQAPGGLSLGTTAHTLLGATARPTVDSRHTDAQRDEALGHPLLAELGTPDFALVVALLLPLALLAGAGAQVQSARADGLWRLMAASSQRAWHWPVAAIGLRWLAVLAIAVLASALAFALDPGSDTRSFLRWLMCLLAYALWWGLATALLALPRISPAAATLSGLGLWLAVLFAVPALLQARADARDPMPSRLAMLIALREAQQSAEQSADSLMARWYAAHPATPRPAEPPGWPRSFMPRYAAQETQVRPLLRDFDIARARRHADLQAWWPLAPGAALLMAADHLAGADARQQLDFQHRVDAYDDAWRAFFLPRIMGAQPLREADFDSLPGWPAPR